MNTLQAIALGLGVALIGTAAYAKARPHLAPHHSPELASGAAWHTLPGGLKYQDLKVGKGANPRTGQTVTVQYTGWLMNGTKFDSSWDRHQPFSFVIGEGQVIKGWDEGVATMKPGGRRILMIPPELGYGAAGTPGGPIPPNATLKFDVELLSIK